MLDETQKVTMPTTSGSTNGNQGEGQLIDSKIGSLSVRSLIVVQIVSTVCIMSIANSIMDLIISYNSKSMPTMTIPEPLYSGFMVAIGAYVGVKATKAGMT